MRFLVNNTNIDNVSFTMRNVRQNLRFIPDAQFSFHFISHLNSYPKAIIDIIKIH